MKQEPKLLTRDEFREKVFERDGGLCVICKSPAKDAHHIMERRLFSDFGYYLDNGACLYHNHHVEAEQTILSCDEIRRAANIKNIILPSHLYTDSQYDKWGNLFIKNGKLRCPGELYWDHSVQKILNSVPQEIPFTEYVKYPRTYHFPWSRYITDDDRVKNELDMFNEEIVMTEKMDGENTTIYQNHLHARSLDSESHWTQSWVRQLQSQIGYELPDGWRICGENLYAQHSISYDNLKSYFYLFSIWNEKNECLSWDDTLEWASLLNLEVVPTIYRGKWEDEPKKIHELWTQKFDETKNEGYVIRVTKSFQYSQFRKCVGKYVRKGHVTSSTHWKYDRIEKIN